MKLKIISFITAMLFSITAYADVQQVTTEAFRNIIKQDNITVVEVYTSWCGYCKLYSPTFEKVSNTNTNITFLKIDVTKNQWVFNGTGGYPSTAIFRNGKMLTSFAGAISQNQLQAYIDHQQ